MGFGMSKVEHTSPKKIWHLFKDKGVWWKALVGSNPLIVTKANKSEQYWEPSTEVMERVHRDNKERTR